MMSKIEERRKEAEARAARQESLKKRISEAVRKDVADLRASVPYREAAKK